MMAERRMFAKTIIDSDQFLDMPLSSQALYFHLGMRADDDGFVNNPKKIQRMIGCADDDFKLLLAKNFLIPFESGVCVIKHWKIHNYIRNDRYKPTVYAEEKAQLQCKENGSYALGIPNGYQTDTQVRLGEDRRGEDRLGEVIDGAEATKPKRFTPPTVEEVQDYCFERQNNVNAQRFIDYYSSNGWMVGRNKMKDWKASVRTWEHKDQSRSAHQATKPRSSNPFLDALEEGVYD